MRTAWTKTVNSEHPSFGNVSTSFSAAFVLHLILGTTLAYFVVSGAQNTRKTKDNALRYLYTMLVVKMRRKKRGGLGVLEGGTRRMEMSMGWGRAG